MNHWRAIRREEKGKIMRTDVLIKIFSDQYSEEEMEIDVARGFQMFYDFEARFSRFKDQSELSCFNRGRGGKVSSELFSLLKECVRFYTLTGGVFDPSILPVLEKIGYAGGTTTQTFDTKEIISQLIFDKEHLTVIKPKDLFIDLGGIGKGYIVDKVAVELSKKYANGIVDAGGDMRIFGGDKEQDLDYFAIDTENPFDTTQILTMLLLSNCAVATSGTNRRHWRKDDQEYHHIIDPLRKTSAKTGVVQVTAIAPSATAADVFAKTLLILGLTQGQTFAEEKNIPALFVTDDKQIIRNALFQKYEWKD